MASLKGLSERNNTAKDKKAADALSVEGWRRGIVHMRSRTCEGCVRLLSFIAVFGAAVFRPGP